MEGIEFVSDGNGEKISMIACESICLMYRLPFMLHSIRNNAILETISPMRWQTDLPGHIKSWALRELLLFVPNRPWQVA